MSKTIPNAVFQVERLPSRSLIRLSGDEVQPFLQGLITNDINTLNENGKALFTFFLNNKGRVLYDSLLYRKTDNELFVECDSSVRDNVIKHLKIFRVRKKVDIEPTEDAVWVIFNANDVSGTTNCDLKDGDILSVCSAPFVEGNQDYGKFWKSTLNDEQIITFGDPRVYALGARVYSPVTKDLSRTLSKLGISENPPLDYTRFRYTLGVAEGIKELPSSNCFPLEANCDYLHGVSFHKGCYLGQELTARTYHTGVVRKRLMPLILSSIPEREPTQDAIIETEDGKKVGKLRGINGKHAIALLRIAECLQNATKLKVHNVSASTYKPFWWPQEQRTEDNLSGDSSL